MTSTKATRLGELTAFDLGSTITFHDGGATYTGTLLVAKHEFPDGRRKTFVLLVSASGKWRHGDRYPSNLPIDEITPAIVRRDPATPPVMGEQGPEVMVPAVVSYAGPSTAVVHAIGDELERARRA